MQEKAKARANVKVKTLIEIKVNSYESFQTSKQSLSDHALSSTSNNCHSQHLIYNS